MLRIGSWAARDVTAVTWVRIGWSGLGAVAVTVFRVTVAGVSADLIGER